MQTDHLLPLRWLILVVALVSPMATAQAQDGRAEVLATGQAVFDAMARRDTAALRHLMHPNAQLIATFERDGVAESRASTLADFLNQIATFEGALLERMWNAEVRVSGTIATIWTQYDFHRNREFSHCGIDSFQLVRGKTGWQVSSLIYTVVRERCPKNPVGPPR